MMKIKFHFESFKNYSDISFGIDLLEILSSEGLEIEKINRYEPIRYEFTKDAFLKMWVHMGHGIMFRGKNPIRFSGMVDWTTKAHPGSQFVCGITLWLTVPNNYDTDKLISLGDKLFEWSKSVYGYITNEIYAPMYPFPFDSKNGKIQYKKCKYPEYVRARSSGNVFSRIRDLMWVNYFGLPYIIETDFHLPDNRVVLSQGAKLQITDSPNDERLCEPDFLWAQKEAVGLGWFWHVPRVCEWRVPEFDRSEVVRDI